MQPSAHDLGVLFESAPRFVSRLAELSAESWDELFVNAERIAQVMPEDEQIELLNAHPRIGADSAAVSALSYREQGYDRDPGTAELQARLDQLNDDYENRFGFRFVVFVNGRSRAQIASLMAQHLDTSRDEEKERALGDVIAIARSRLATLSAHKAVEREEAQ